jgi:lysozyme
MIPQLISDLKSDEGWRPYAYKDSEGLLTIGYGFLVDPAKGVGLPRHIGDMWLTHAVQERASELFDRIPWLEDQPEEVQRALCNMAYQLGVYGVLKFRKMLYALEHGDRAEAAIHALDSLWAKQTPERAERIAALISP